MNSMTRIPGYCFIKTKPIEKGLSGDKKFYLETEKGERYLARISPCTKFERKRTVYERLQKVSRIELPMPAPVELGYCESKSEIYTLLTWVDGEDAQNIVPEFTYESQYRLGMEAGRILRKLHDNSVTKCREDWQTRYFSVIEPRLRAYRDENVSFDGSVQVLDYLKANKYLLSSRPQTLHHGDFHLGNMIIGANGQLSVIDWDTADFENIGDPWYEFNRISLQVPAFASGQIDGYFGNDVPDEFWRLLTFYMAGSAITSIVWAKYFAPERMDEIMKLNTDIVRWHIRTEDFIPVWYDRKSKQMDT